MRIVHVSAYYIEDLAKGYQVFELVREHISDGHEVHIVTSNQNIGNKNYIENAIKTGKITTNLPELSTADSGAIIHRLSPLFKVTGRLWWKKFKSTLIDLQPNYIIVHNILEFQTLRLLFFAEELNCPIVFDDHTTINLVRRDFFGKLAYWIFRSFFADYLYSKASSIVGISDSCTKVLNKQFGLKGEKITMIPLGCNTKIYYPDINKRKIYRENIRIGNDEILIVYTGKVYDEKKVHLIISALNDKMFQGNKIAIQIVGTVYNDYKEFLTSEIENSTHRVILTPNVNHEELSKIYNSADICVWPAHTTTSTLDASACGSPIICSDYKKERYSYGNGIGIKDGDLESLKIALKELINNNNLRNYMSERGIQMIKDNHQWTEISRRFIDFK